MTGPAATRAPRRPFLLLSVRDDRAAADDEYRAVRRFGGLGADELHRVVLTRTPLGQIDLDDWSGVILGGGPYNVSDPPESKSATQRRVEGDLRGLLERIVDRDFPFLGCCYGVGTLGAVVGATVDRRFPEPVGPVTVELTDDGRADPLFAGVPSVFDALGGHREAASALPAGTVRLAQSAACPVQAFRVGTNVYATQFHPELDADGMATRVEAYKHAGYFPPETADAIKAAAHARHIEHSSLILRNFVVRWSR
ncbi:glutamine amidotransferase [Mycobacterium sp. ACS4331]|nr:glutamine amidotransferase [Mycobacterium sp. ACS4331]